MSKLKEEELLKRLRNWWLSLDKAWPSFQLSWTKRDQQAYQQIKEMIQKPAVTEEWIEEKAKMFILKCPGITAKNHFSIRKFAKDFIHKLVEEIRK